MTTAASLSGPKWIDRWIRQLASGADHSVVRATACVLFHHARAAGVDDDATVLLAAACLRLAAKMEEEHDSAVHFLRGDLLALVQAEAPGTTYASLNEVEFRLIVAIPHIVFPKAPAPVSVHAYSILAAAAGTLSKDCVQLAMNIVNDSYLVPACLHYDAPTIAAAAIDLSCSVLAVLAPPRTWEAREAAHYLREHVLHVK